MIADPDNLRSSRPRKRRANGRRRVRCSGELAGREFGHEIYDAWVVSHRFSDFFFSSRRRHTRSTRDWSSDVCSSDLAAPVLVVEDEPSFRALITVLLERIGFGVSAAASVDEALAVLVAQPLSLVVSDYARSEERRVGKECRSRWWSGR